MSRKKKENLFFIEKITFFYNKKKKKKYIYIYIYIFKLKVYYKKL